MERLNFDEIVDKASHSSTNAQTTLLYRLIQIAGPAVLRSAVRYAFQRLDEINKALPDGHKYKELYKRKQNDREDQVHSGSAAEQLRTGNVC